MELLFNLGPLNINEDSVDLYYSPREYTGLGLSYY